MGLYDLHALNGLVTVAAEGGGTSSLIAEIGTTILGFLIVFFILKKYAFHHILAIIDERREKIETDINRAEELQKKAELEKKELDERLAGIEKEARGKMQESIAEGQRIAEKIQEDARNQSAEIIEKARQNIEVEMDKARVELKEEIIKMTIQATEHLIKERLDDEKHKQLIGDFLERIERN